MLNPNRRKLIKGMGACACCLLPNTHQWANAAFFNPCVSPAMEGFFTAKPEWRTFWDKAIKGLDFAQVWDMHTHIAGVGDGGTGVEINPQMESLAHPWQSLQKLIYMRASCATTGSGKVDQEFEARLTALVNALPTGAKAVLFAFDHHYTETGAINREHSAFHVPNAYARRWVQTNPARYQWAASIHPYRHDALAELARATEGEHPAVAIKWLPAAMGMDPASPKCIPFFKALAQLNLPVIVHCGEEKAVHGGNTQHLGNPLRLRHALDLGVRVVVAHCASTGEDTDEDAPSKKRVPSFDLFARLMDSPQYRGRLFGDISAIAQRNRPIERIQTIIARTDWHDRLLNGSDYPLPAIFQLTPLSRFVSAGMITKQEKAMISALREHNALAGDLALKRLWRWQGKGLSDTVFHTQNFFARVG